MNELVQLADLIRARNRVARDIAALICRPALIGHVGEYIAAQVFKIDLEKSASRKAMDGRFTAPPLAGRSVNIKWYAAQEGLLDLTPGALPDFYLVLTGPKRKASSSCGTVRSWLIEAVYLFASDELIQELESRGVKQGIATSVRGHLWEAAEIYPEPRNRRLILSDEQREMLALFGLKEVQE
jgi:hypothetical protein